jgi:serine/threonine protein kinase
VSGSYLEPVLIDFGVAARSEFVRANGGSLQTMSAEYINYSRNTTAPEVKVDFQKVDVYSLGVVMYRMITGEYPFNAWGRDGLTSRIVKGSFDLPRTRNPKLPPEVDELMNRWISKEPIYRPSLIELNRKMLDWAGGNGPYYLTEELVAGDEKRNGGLRTKTQMVNKPTGSETL